MTFNRLFTCAAGAAFISASAALADPAPAQSYNFSYKVQNGATFTALISGQLGGDSNTVTVLSFSGAKVDGDDWAGTYDVDSLDVEFGFDANATPRLTLDGSFVDVYFGITGATDSDNAFGIAVGSQAATIFSGALISTTGPMLGSATEAFVLANYSLTPLTAVPLPGGLVLLGTGLGFLVLRRRG